VLVGRGEGKGWWRSRIWGESRKGKERERTTSKEKGFDLQM